MKNILVDSDILIDFLRGQMVARDYFELSYKHHELYISVVSLTEIYSGKDTTNLKKLREIELFFSNFEVAFITPSIAKFAGFLRRDYNKPLADTLIAATAIEYNFTLVTRNIKHFQNFKQLKLQKPYG